LQVNFKNGKQQARSDVSLAARFSIALFIGRGIFLPPAPESDSDFRLASKLASKLENLIFNQRAYALQAL
jgi:hypothetical protein